MVTKPTSTAHQFLAGGGEMGERIRSYDWATTSLGDPAEWPQNLKTCIRIILTSSQPMFVWWGKDLINIYNDAYKSIVKGKHPEALGQPASIVWKEIWDQTGPRAETVIRDNIGTYDEALLLIMERNGYPEETYYTFSYSPIAGEDGVDGIICANSDATERIISERQLRTLRDLGKNILRATNEMEICDKTLEVIQQNPQDFPFAFIYLVDKATRSATLCEKTDNIKSDRIAPPFIEINENAPWWLDHAISKNRIIIAEDVYKYGQLPAGPWQQPPHKALVIPITQQGQEYPYAVLIVGMNPFRLPDEEYQSFFQLIADQVASGISAVHALEEERTRAKALTEIDKSKTIFFSNISHEFRTPLTLMLGPLEDLLQHSNGLEEHNKRIIKTTHRNALRLLRLVNALLDFSRIESGRIHANYQRTDIAAFTDDLVSNFRSVTEKAGLTLEVNCEEIHDPVYVDKEMWEKIVLNLLSNAYKFTLKGKISVTIQQQDGHAKLQVEDTGVGIPEKELPRLFERFHRVQNAGGRSHEGTGIGLSLVNELVKFHHGTIAVTSKEDKGTAFIVSIPVGREHLPPAQVNEKETAFSDDFSAYVQQEINLSEDIVPENNIGSPVTATEPDSKKATVLIVDDNADMRHYLSGLLEKDYTVRVASNGSDALDIIDKHPPDIVLSDVMMPVMDGIQLLKTIKEDLSLHIPVILLSARAGEESRIEGLNIGADDYLVKPFSAKELMARLQSQVKLTAIRKKVDEAEFRYRLALDSAHMGAFDADLETGDTIRNMRHARIFGYSDTDEPWTIQKMLEHALPEDRPIIEKQLSEIGRTDSYELEWRIVRKDKAIRWIRTNARVLYDNNKVAKRIIGTILDITDQKLQNTALEQSEQRLRGMIMQAPVSIAIMRGPEFIFEIANEGYFRMAGKLPEQLLDKALLEALPELADQGIKKILTKVRDTGKPYFGNEFPTILNRFGKEEMVYFNFVYQPLREADHSIDRVMVVATDVTEQVNSRNKIIEAEERSRLAIEAAELGSYSLDMKTGEFTHTERTAELFGYDRNEKLDHKLLVKAIHPDHAAIRIKAHEEAARTGYLNYEAKFNGSDGRSRWLKLTGRMFYDEQHEPDRLLGAIMDTTEQRELQQRKDDFIRMASHELKTPVTSIKGYVQLLLNILTEAGEEDTPVSPVIFKSSLSTIDRQIVKLTRLMSELLDVSKIETGKLELAYESFNLNELVANTVEEILYTNPRHPITIKHDYVCNVYGDKDRLTQVFINIINNAIKYSPRNEEIEIRIYEGTGKKVITSIKDQGIGIDSAYLDRIFERFFRVEGRNEQTYPGFGIGLFIAKEIIARHNGMIKVKSEKDEGSEFKIFLPVHNEIKSK